MIKKMATMAAAVSLAFGSVAPAFAAHPLSVADSPAARASADMQDSSQLGDMSDTTTQIAVLVVIALLIWAGTELFDDDEPDSP